VLHALPANGLIFRAIALPAALSGAEFRQSWENPESEGEDHFDEKTGSRSPGDFPIGSIESRAAMRLQLANRRDSRQRIEIVSNIARPDIDNAKLVRIAANADQGPQNRLRASLVYARGSSSRRCA
jgi:hypothetical protein